MSRQIKKTLIITRSKCKSRCKKVKINDMMMELTTGSSNFSTTYKNQRMLSSMRNSKTNIAKKLEIKNYKHLPNLPDNYKKMTWIKLHDAILAIQNSKPIKYPLEELYQTVQNLCEHKMGEMIYENLKNLLETYITVTIIPFLKEYDDSYSYINKVNDWWLRYCKQMSVIRSIFLYLDRTYVLQNPGVLSIVELGISIFKTHIIYNPCVQSKTEEGLLALIKEERGGASVDRPLIKSLIKMFVDLELYKFRFEEKYLVETANFYYAEGCRLIEELDIPDYLKHVNQRIKEEELRMSYYIHSITVIKTIKIVVKQLLGDHVKTIITNGLEPLLENNKINDLSLMYDLCNTIKNGSSELCSHFNLYIKNKGKTIIAGTEPEIIQNLLDLKDKVDNILNTSFNENPKYVTSVKEAFEYFINHRPNKPAELLAKFVDQKLRAGNKKSTDDELEKLLDKIMVMFRFIHSKDVFEAFYKRYLAKRLLVDKSASVDAEKSMLCKLKQECGGGFTSKLEGMFKDMELSKDINITFKQHLNNILNNEQTIDLNVNILTMGFWPTYPVSEVTLPDNLGQYQNFFNNFYLSKHSGRKLQWQSKLGHCVLQSWFPLGNKELQVSLFQTLVLLLFNKNDYLMFEEIKQACNMEEKELRRTLQSLACGKARVLKKIPKGKEVSDTDQFHYNLDFTNKYFRIKINQVQMKETPEEQKHTEERVFQDRQYQIDAAIVRIMKMKKSLTHNLLISELYEKLKFPIKPQDLKKRIESLIDQEYIERDKDNADHYHYVA